MGFCLCAATVLSASPWFARVWQADDGLPGDNVTGVAQTRDGYLWVATQTGLARFDGVHFLNYKIPLGRERPIIRAMLLDDKGRLWLAEEGGTLVSILDEQPAIYTPTNGLSKAQPLEMVQDAGGGVWVANVDGTVCRILGGEVKRFGDNDGLPVGGNCNLIRDAQKQVWFAKSGQVGIFRDGKFLTLLNFNDRPIHLQARIGGGVWICAGDRLLRYELGGSPSEIATIPPDTTPARSTTLFEDSSRALWIGTVAGGLFRCEGTNVMRIETSHRRIRAITEDREGNIWVGTDGGGLNRLRRQVVEIQGKEAGLPFDTVRSACEDANGTFWVVTQNGELVNNESGNWETISSTLAWNGGQATCVTCDKRGVVWIGTFSHGLFCWKDKKFTILRHTAGLAQSSIRSLFADSRGGLWIAFSVGDVLQYLFAGKFKNYDLPPDSRPVRAFTEDAKGSIWMANLDMRLLRVEGDGVVDETGKTPEPFHPIRSLAATPDGSLWIGYSSSGVGRLKGRQFVKIGYNEGLRDDSICSLTPDEMGSMWFGSDHGIFRASVDDLLRTQPGGGIQVKCFGYGRDEGLPSLESYYGYAPGAWRTRDGRILIPTHSGLAIGHPNRVRMNTVPPLVTIERVALDNRAVKLPADGLLLQVPPSHRKVEITFTAPSFVEPEKVRFRYWLEGWDEEPVEVGDDRSASYSRLPAGRYCFHVTASNSDGFWNEFGAKFTFEVTPFFWQTWWFYLVAVSVFIMTVFMIVRYVSVKRLQTRLQKLEKENILQKERARIAQDIHDDLGARMTQISLLTDLVQNALAQPDKAGAHISQIANISRQGVRSLDEIVWAVNPRNDTLADLLDYAGQYAVDFLRPAGIRCRIDFPINPPPHDISGETRHGLFLAVKEALNNVVKHAHATEVWLRVTVTEEKLSCTIEDNGCGFDAAPDNALADGLRNMQARLAEIGWVCSIKGRSSAGARVMFEVPWRRK